jgi:hypothetical protein
MGNKELYTYIGKLENYVLRTQVQKLSSANKDLGLINFDRTDEQPKKEKGKKKRKKTRTEEVDLITYLKDKFNYGNAISKGVNYMRETFSERSGVLKNLLCKTATVSIYIII